MRWAPSGVEVIIAESMFIELSRLGAHCADGPPHPPTPSPPHPSPAWQVLYDNKKNGENLAHVAVAYCYCHYYFFIIYTYTHTHTHIYIYIYIYIYRLIRHNSACYFKPSSGTALKNALLFILWWTNCRLNFSLNLLLICALTKRPKFVENKTKIKWPKVSCNTNWTRSH
jgi:hypothetical protein